MAALFVKNISFPIRYIFQSSFRIYISRSCSVTSTNSQKGDPIAKNENKDTENVEPWMKQELEYYSKGLDRLATAMGVHPSELSEKSIRSALMYLLPSKLSAPDARPFLKHPSDIYPKRKESLFHKERPMEAGFYTGFPQFTNLLHDIYTYYLEGANATQPTEHNKDSSSNQEGVSRKKRWKRKEEMEDLIQESLTSEQYQQLISTLKKVEELVTSSNSNFLDQFRRPVASFSSRSTIKQLHEGTVSSAVGKRKSAVAYVDLSKGSGIITVNGRNLIEYFPRVQDREQILYPLAVVDMLGRYDVTAHIRGGGITGQTGALRHGISKALLPLSEVFKEKLIEERLVIRDPRAVERKKPGQKKARKKFSWVKR